MDKLDIIGIWIVAVSFVLALVGIVIEAITATRKEKRRKEICMAEKITADTLVSTTELACVLGITGRRIRQLAEDGVLDKVKEGRFNLSDSVQKYNLFSSSNMTKEEIEAEKKINKAKVTADITIKTSKAKIEKLKADELEGKMHRSEDVEAMTTDLVCVIRGMLIALPGRLAVDVADVKSAAEASEIIKKEVYAIMRELSQYKYDPKKYEERVRDRLKWDNAGDEDDD